MSDKIREALAGMLAIVDESRGVEGYHLNGAIAEWDEFPEVEAARTALAQQPAPAVPDEGDADNAPWMSADTEPAIAWRDGWNACRSAMLAAAPAAPVAQEPVAWEQRATEAHALLRRVYDSGFDDDCVDAVGNWLNEHHPSPAAEQPGTAKIRDLLKRYFDALDRFDREGPVSLVVAAAKEADALEKELRDLLAGGA